MGIINEIGLWVVYAIIISSIIPIIILILGSKHEKTDKVMNVAGVVCAICWGSGFLVMIVGGIFIIVDKIF